MGGRVMTKEVFKELFNKIEAKEKKALTTIVNSSTSPELVGGKILVGEEGEPVTNLPSECLTVDELEQLVTSSLETLSRGGIDKYELELTEKEEDIEFIVESYLPNPRLIILGGGHVGQALYQFAKELDFELIIIDDRPSFANWDNFPEADRVICVGFADFLTKMEITGADYIVIATRGHRHDYTCLKQVLGSKAEYIGMLGSKRKVNEALGKLQEEGYSKEKMERINAPIGLKIGSETPPEISISILAEVIEKRRKGEQQGNYLIGKEVIEFLVTYQGEYDKLALATIIDTSGSTPRNSGAKMLVLPDGRTHGTIGGGCGESEVRQKALDVINGQLEPLIHTLKLSNEIAAKEGMVCGGKMEVFIEPIRL